MDSKHSMYKKFRLFLTFLISGVLAAAFGCGDNADVVVIDFSKAVAVDKSEGDSPKRPRIRVAVGALAAL